MPHQTKSFLRMLAYIISIWLMIIGIGSILRAGLLQQFPLPYIEMLGHAIFFVFFLSIPAVSNYVRNLPSAHKAIYLLFLMLLLIGQFTYKKRLTYPFPPWPMYSHSENHNDQVTYYRYQATNDHGTQFFIAPEQLIPSNDKYVIVTKLKHLIEDGFHGSNGKQIEKSRKKLRDLLKATAGFYQRRHPDESLVSLEILEYTWHYRDQDQDAVQPSSLWKFPLQEESL